MDFGEPSFFKNALAVAAFSGHDGRGFPVYAVALLHNMFGYLGRSGPLSNRTLVLRQPLTKGAAGLPHVRPLALATSNPVDEASGLTQAGGLLPH